MNHIYSIIWNHATACYQAVAENAKGSGKGKQKRATKEVDARQKRDMLGTQTLPLTASAVGVALYVLSLASHAALVGGKVSAGSATITQNGGTTTINQTSNRAAIDWTKFSVSANESVRFKQPNASSLTLNRVTGTEPSSILGNISANGQVFILNPNGVLFGAGAQVNVGGLVASTLGLSNANFMAGNYQLAGGNTGSVINHGSITVAPGGTLALIAPVVQNTGALSAAGGSVLLAGAQAVTLNLQSDGGLVAYTLDTGSAQALVDNGGLIQAGGGHVVLTAKGVDALSRAVVNHSGVIEAQTVSNKSGVIELLGDMQSGMLNVSGKLDAAAAYGGDGGFIETSAAKVKIADTAQITTSAISGKTGNWLIDPMDFTIADIGGDLTPATLAAQLANSNATIATGASGTGNGDIFVNSPVAWSNNQLTLTAHRNININANLNGSGTAKLALTYGQATANGAGSDYVLGSGAKVNLPAGSNFSTQQGSTGTFKNFTVINSLGAAGSTTASDLQGMSGDLIMNYALGGDIDASATSGWNSGEGFLPIGPTNHAFFRGAFTGLGHTITGLHVNRPALLGVGLFGFALNTEIRDVGLINGQMTGDYIVGGLVGNIQSTIISNSYNTGTVTGDRAVGGLVGYAILNGWIVNCYATGNVVGGSSPSGDAIGGLVGRLSMGYSIGNSYASGNVYGHHFVGGLAGEIAQSGIGNSYATGSVTAEGGGVGGLLGVISDYSTVTNSYATGRITSVTGAPVSGLVSHVYGFGTAINNGFWDINTTGAAISNAGGTGKTTAEMQQQATFTGWDFVNTWRIVEGSSYPLLRALTQGTITLDVTASSPRKTYDGNAINTLSDLQALPGGFSVTAGNTLANGDTLPALDVAGTGIWSGTLNINGAGNSWQGAKDAGAYSIVPGGLSSQKYEIVYKNGALTIDPAGISIVGVSGSRSYDGTRLANWNENTQLLGGVLPADQGKVSLVSGTGVLASKNVGSQPLISTGTLTLGGTAAGNYQLGTSGSSWTITPASLVISGVADSKVYDSTTVASGSINQVSGQLFGTDSLSGGVLAFADANAATKKSVHLSGVAVNDDNGGDNYTVTYQNGSGIILPKPIDITLTKTYDGTRVANWNDNTPLLGGVLASDKGKVSVISGTGILASKNVGTQPLISLGSLTLGGTAAGNYQLGSTGSSWIIKPASLIISGAADSKVYDGKVDATGSVTKVAGQLFGGDSITGGVLVFANANAAVNKSVKVSGAAVNDGNGGSNYAVTYQNGSGVILPKPIDITVAKTYDGTRVANWNDNTPLLSGVLASDKGKVAVVSGAGILTSKNVGTQALISLGSLTLGGTAAGNYQLSSTGSSWSITPAKLVISGTADSKVYDGKVDASGSVTKVAGQLFGSDSISGGAFTFADANAGTNKSVLVSGAVVADGNGGGSYSVTYQNGSGIILPRPIDITVTKTYDGKSIFNSGFKVSNRVGNDAINVSGFGMTSIADAGNYDTFAFISLTLNNSNYTLAGGKTIATIDRAPLSLEAVRDYNNTNNADASSVVQIHGVLDHDKNKVSLMNGTSGKLQKEGPGTSNLLELGTLQLEGEAAHNYFLATTTSEWRIRQPIAIKVVDRKGEMPPRIDKPESAALEQLFDLALNGKTKLIESIAKDSQFLTGHLAASEIFSSIKGNIALLGAAPAFLLVELDSINNVINATQKKLTQSAVGIAMHDLDIDFLNDLGNATKYQSNPYFLQDIIQKLLSEKNTSFSSQTAFQTVSTTIDTLNSGIGVFKSGKSAAETITDFRDAIESTLDVTLGPYLSGETSAGLLKQMEKLATSSFGNSSGYDQVDAMWGNFKSVLVEVSRDSSSNRTIVANYMDSGDLSFNNTLTNALIELKKQSKGDEVKFFENGAKLFTSLKAAYDATKKMKKMIDGFSEIGLSPEIKLQPSDQTLLLIQAAIIEKIKVTNPTQAEELLSNQQLLKPTPTGTADIAHPGFLKRYTMQSDYWL